MTRILAFLAACVFATAATAEIDITEVTSDGGITAWLVEEHSIPFVALEIRFRGGASLDEDGKRGATYLMTGLLEEGAGDLDARDFSRAREELAASFDYDVYDDAVSISARFLTENRAEAVDLLRQSLAAPRFDPDAIDRVRAQVLSIIRSDLSDPDEITAAAFDARVFGDHPYGTPKEGTPDSVAALTRDDIQRAHANALVRDRVYIGAVGDITPEELGSLLDRILGDLPETGPPLPGRATPAFDGGTHVVPFDTPQSVARFGQLALAQDHPDYFAAYILNTVLGGSGRESRLMEEVREKRGLTYGVYSFIMNLDQADVWMGTVSSANDRMAEAIGVIRDEWTRIARDGVTPEELRSAKKYLTGAYPLRFDGNGPIANILAGMQIADMPIDYAATRNDRIEAVTLDEVNRLARDMLDPEALSFVVTGKPEGLTDAGN